MHYLFLQGGYSSFFNRVADGLVARGHLVTGINFCAGDQWLWRDKDTINYRGRLRDWPAFIAQYFEQHAITDVVLLGEQRDYHKQAVEAAQRRGIRVLVTDFGYLRPDWLTLERDGMGGNSHFPKDPQALLEYGKGMPSVDRQARYSDRLRDMAFGDLVYSFANVLLWFLFPHYRRSDHRAHPLRYFPSIGWRLLFSRRRNRQAEETFAQLQGGGKAYFLFPMQLDHDFQIQAYSPFCSVDEAIRLVMSSFCEHAPADNYLLFKVHPWDPGFKNWRRRIVAWARDSGVEGRVVFVDGGSLAEMLRHAKGMVTVNSTSAVQAFQVGCPVACLGQAIFNMPGLTHQDALASFWTEPPKPNRELVDAFERLLAGSIQFRGVFYSEPGLTAAVEEAVKRLDAPQRYASPWAGSEVAGENQHPMNS